MRFIAYAVLALEIIQVIGMVFILWKADINRAGIREVNDSLKQELERTEREYQRLLKERDALTKIVMTAYKIQK